MQTEQLLLLYLQILPPAVYFQTPAVLTNAGLTKGSQTVFTNDILRITAQNGTVVDYVITVQAAAPVVGSTNLNESSTKVSVDNTTCIYHYTN